MLALKFLSITLRCVGIVLLSVPGFELIFVSGARELNISFLQVKIYYSKSQK